MKIPVILHSRIGLGVVWFIHLSHSGGYEVLLQCALNCIPVMTNEVATLFIGHLDIPFYVRGGFCKFSNCACLI